MSLEITFKQISLQYTLIHAEKTTLVDQILQIKKLLYIYWKEE